MIKFLKMHGLGNDFAIIDQRIKINPLTIDFIQKISDRRFGVGCDQLIVLEPSQNADLFMRIYNSNGSEAQSCGNATRCVADMLMRESGRESCIIETRGGVLPCARAQGGMVTADMGVPRAIDLPPGELWGRGLPEPVGVDMGNPHCVFFVDNVSDIPVDLLGPAVENHPAFLNKTNVEFAQILAGDKIRVRVWERGAGITLACGSGACATMVAAARSNLTRRSAEIIMDGGSLFLEWRENDSHVLMTGPVAYVFEGELA